MKPKWSLGDLLDLEFFFQADESLRRKEGEEALRKRDRIIYLSRIAPRLTGVDPHPTLFVKEWLLVRRHGERQAAEEGRPGEVEGQAARQGGVHRRAASLQARRAARLRPL